MLICWYLSNREQNERQIRLFCCPTGFMEDECPHPWVLELTLRTIPYVLFSLESRLPQIHHTSPDRNTQIINQVPPWLFIFSFTSFPQFFYKAAGIDTFWKYWRQYLQIYKGKWVADIWREKQCAPFDLFMGISFCLKRHQTVALSLEHADSAEEAQSWAPTQHQAGTCVLLFTTHPSNQCLNISVCFYIHELALWLNDACRWCPSLLPHLQLEAGGHCSDQGSLSFWILRQLLLHPRLTGSPLWWCYEPPGFTLSPKRNEI